MLTSLALVLSPFVLNGVMSVVKWLGNMQAGQQTGAKRFFLALFALAGVVAFSALSGNPVDPNSISSLVQTIFASFATFVLAHGSYTLFWQQAATATPPPTQG